MAPPEASPKRHSGGGGGGGALAIVAPAIVLALAAALHAAASRPDSPLLAYADVPPAHTKPYASFDEFYPFYLTQHSQPNTRRLHYLGTGLFVAGVASSPALALAAGAAVALGAAVSPFLRHQPSGLVEFAVMLGAYLSLGASGTGSWRRAALPMVAAYALAWAAHAAVEHNRPATFIYPSYSLMGAWARAERRAARAGTGRMVASRVMTLRTL